MITHSLFSAMIIFLPFILPQNVSAFLPRINRIFLRNNKFQLNSNAKSKRLSSLYMKDRSSAYWFKVGDKVRVIDDVQKGGKNLNGMVGKVVETWDKCEVDPTCCCAEFVDENFAVRVKFQDFDGDDFIHYFAEIELEKIESETLESTMEENDQRAFDGMTCTSFKLDKLKMGKQAQRIAKFQASRHDDN